MHGVQLHTYIKLITY